MAITYKYRKGTHYVEKNPGQYMFRGKGIFLSESRARAYAAKLRESGKRVQVRTFYSGGIQSKPTEWGVYIWAKHDPLGRNFKADYRRT